jgi:hypothetical protein
MKSYEILWNPMKSYEILWNIMKYYEIMQDNAKQYKIIQDNRTSHNATQRVTIHCNTLQYTAIHCNTLQYTAIHCNTLQYTAMHCNMIHCISAIPVVHVLWCWSILFIWVALSAIIKFASVVSCDQRADWSNWNTIMHYITPVLRLTQTSNDIFKICQKELLIGKIKHSPIITLRVLCFLFLVSCFLFLVSCFLFLVSCFVFCVS